MTDYASVEKIVLVIGFMLFGIGWLFYYLSWPYWKRKDFLDKFTDFGLITMYKHIDKMREPGKKYAIASLVILGLTPILLIVTLLILKFRNII